MRDVLLLLVALLAGGALMALEIVGVYLLAPHFGQTLFVWASLIGVFLAALSIGYYLGGRLVDRWPTPYLLAAFLAASGLFVMLLALPVQVEGETKSLAWMVGDAMYARDIGPRAGPLVTCALLFFIPAMLMAVTSPFVIRLTARSVSRVGTTAGMVYTVSTVGSIAGTLGSAFYLISWFRVPTIVLLLGGLLVVTAIIAAAVRRPREAATVAVALLALCGMAQPSYAGERILLERNSAYHRLFVTEDDRYRWLRADNIWHTQMLRADPHGRGLPYSNYIDLAFLFNPNIRSVLVIGLGGGTVPKRFVRDYPSVKVDAVEVDPDVVTMAARYFEVKPGPRLAIHTSDGRMFLRKSKQKWDLILLDAYYADTVPFFLTTKEFFKIVHDHLTPNGVFVNNVVGQLSGPKSKFFRSVYRTTKEVFPQIHVVRVPESGFELVNLEVFALKTKSQISRATLAARAKEMQGSVIKDARLSERLEAYVTARVRTDDVPTLSDDYAPVDALMHLW